MGIDLQPITDETRAKAERWLKAPDGGKIFHDGFAIEDMLPGPGIRPDRVAEVLAYAQSEVRANKGRRGNGAFDMSFWHRGAMIVKQESSPPPMPCGTTACLAGTAAAFYMPVGFKLRGEMVYKPSGIYHQATESVGRDELGLTRDQAAVLFYMTSARFETIQRVASLMTGRELTGDLSRFLATEAAA